MDKQNKEYELRVKDLENEIKRLQDDIQPSNLSEQELKEIITHEISNYRDFIKSGKERISEIQHKLEDDKSFFERMKDIYEENNSNNISF